jgi:hypothetical protein
MRSHSLEWWTNVSDTVAIAEVASTKKIEPLNEYWQSQEVRCTVTKTLQGKRRETFTFRQDYRDQEPGEMSAVAVLRPRTRVLLFCVRPAESRKIEIIFWVNLSRPDAKLSMQAPFNNDCKWLKDGQSVLALVKSRVKKENLRNRAKKRGVIVPFTAYDAGDMYWDFVRTADPEYKAVLIKELRNGDKESAIYNLISYPGKETRDLIRPLLIDGSTGELQVIGDSKDPPGDRIDKFYPVRQAAYRALKLLGESPKKPKGYDPDVFLWLFTTGFEHRAYFPYGDWKRLRRDK